MDPGWVVGVGQAGEQSLACRLVAGGAQAESRVSSHDRVSIVFEKRGQDGDHVRLGFLSQNSAAAAPWARRRKNKSRSLASPGRCLWVSENLGQPSDVVFCLKVLQALEAWIGADSAGTDSQRMPVGRCGPPDR
jgi:hypothetical protein